MTAPLERAARAICADFGVNPERPVTANDDMFVEAGVREPHLAWERYVSMASAVLAALREPTDSMIDAGMVALNRAGASWPDATTLRLAIWPAMIDAALAETE